MKWLITDKYPLSNDPLDDKCFYDSCECLLSTLGDVIPSSVKINDYKYTITTSGNKITATVYKDGTILGRIFLEKQS